MLISSFAQISWVMDWVMVMFLTCLFKNGNGVMLQSKNTPEKKMEEQLLIGASANSQESMRPKHGLDNNELAIMELLSVPKLMRTTKPAVALSSLGKIRPTMGKLDFETLCNNGNETRFFPRTVQNRKNSEFGDLLKQCRALFLPAFRKPQGYLRSTAKQIQRLHTAPSNEIIEEIHNKSDDEFVYTGLIECPKNRLKMKYRLWLKPKVPGKGRKSKMKQRKLKRAHKRQQPKIVITKVSLGL